MTRHLRVFFLSLTLLVFAFVLSGTATLGQQKDEPWFPVQAKFAAA
jgi:hypothetical protein